MLMTAYELLLWDGISDVCSSYLAVEPAEHVGNVPVDVVIHRGVEPARLPLQHEAWMYPLVAPPLGGSSLGIVREEADRRAHPPGSPPAVSHPTVAERPEETRVGEAGVIPSRIWVAQAN